jgi:hypothetical protein
MQFRKAVHVEELLPTGPTASAILPALLPSNEDPQ